MLISNLYLHSCVFHSEFLSSRMESDTLSFSKEGSHENPGKPCKLLVQDLVASRLMQDGTWQLQESSKTGEGSIPLVHDGTVWIQGVIAQTSTSDTMIVEDETGKVTITNCTAIDYRIPWIKEGVYCLVIGKLLNNPGEVTVSAMKLVCLDSNAVHQTIWKAEVEEVRCLLTNQIKITP